MSGDEVHRADEATAEDAADGGDDGGFRLLRALLAIDPERAREIRAGTARPRPRPQAGPSADYGD